MTKRLQRVLAGEAVWPPPTWLMRQAGRYLPEYRAVRAHAGDFISLCTTPELATEVTLQPVRRYGMDAAILFSDILVLPWALGQGLAFREGEGPVLPPIRDAAGVAALDPARLPGAIAPILETVRRVRAEVGEATLIGFAGSPFTVACYMIEGGGSKDFAHVRGMAYRDPALFARLLDLLTEATVVYLAAQIEAGAEVVMLFDSWAGVLSPTLFRAHVTAPTRRIVAALKALHPDIQVIGFPRLAGMLVGEYAAETGVQGVGIDTSADLSLVRGLVPDGIALQGNLDPMALVAGGAALESETRAILAAARGRPHVFNLGHGIVPQTPPEHVAALLHMIRAA
ncbi:uroporphyrinogen decarboxylase [Limobrevibacterium gyesilva]|uniref:Uroporphyrinogen decarboxylase n=1 Tax=Limobrevibacterium gyesilva TaxID=2991712 RepID=A0AA41YJU1_9PROT|nr:uroporphyrinogen decarboxylase [Limobrevibacterium gyesilva]MCW3473621.1 uroporphyrinogen decarboxylase [Limobrevibacterium gyesilva]